MKMDNRKGYRGDYGRDDYEDRGRQFGEGYGGGRSQQNQQGRDYRQQGGEHGRSRWQEDQYSRDYRQQGGGGGGWQGERGYGGRQTGSWAEDDQRHGSRGGYGGGSFEDRGYTGEGGGSYEGRYGGYGGGSSGYGGRYGASGGGYGSTYGGGGYGEGSDFGNWESASRSGYGSREEWQGAGSFPQSSGYSRSDRDYGGRGYGGQDYGGYRGQFGPGRGASGRSYGGGERGSSEGGRDFWDKASDEVSSWFGDRDAERRREMDRHRGRGPRNYMRSDDRIREDVNDRLTDDNWIDASDIEVTVSQGEVTLSGLVDDRMTKRRAEDIADDVSGVRHVQNNLRVREKPTDPMAARMATSSDQQTRSAGQTSSGSMRSAGTSTSTYGSQAAGSSSSGTTAGTIGTGSGSSSEKSSGST
jgi:osmotically-inducible protein OsmY